MEIGPFDKCGEGVNSVHLKISECIFTKRPMIISTVLGSCVSATFFDSRTRASAMFHALLPDSGMGGGKAGDCKFVNSAIENIVRRYLKLGVEVGRITVNLFGGAFTFKRDCGESARNIVDVGIRNVEIAKARLKDFGFKITLENVLGDRGRKLYFHTGAGQVWMKYVGLGSAKKPGNVSPSGTPEQ